MKKLIGLFLSLLLLLSVFTIAAYASSPTGSLTGPQTVRAGDTITLTYTMTCEDIIAIVGNLDYDNTQLELISYKQEIGSSWDLTSNGNKLWIEDSKFTNPIKGTSKVLTLIFYINKDLAEGTVINIKFTGVSATSLSEEFEVAEASYTATIAKPLSKDNTLKDLTVSNATISPAFDPAVTSYTATVPYSVSKLNITAVQNDAAASIAYNNPTLAADTVTSVSVTVTAENGSTKTYTIKVQREKDPNYVASGNNYLSEIAVEEFRLSPVFDKEISRYLIWLPYEVDQVVISGTAEDKNAAVEVQGGKDLIAGADNEIKVICTAENGEERIYTVIAKRAAAHDAQPTEPTTPSTEPTEPTTPSTEPTRPSNTQPSQSVPTPTEPADKGEDGGMSTLLLILYIIIALIAVGGIVVCVLFFLGSKSKGKFSR